ncbi:FecR family protein [Shinella zoogloeoides]|uniref:FecR family protein n=1 Tax=Shinella zoogloeoides TaxID=352475 RepID=UPI0028A7C869|nr:FecR family protein [Shinella zoogloeoides]
MGLDPKDDRSRPEGGHSSDDPVADEALDWFVRMRDGKPDREALEAFHAWRCQSPQHAEEFRSLEALWGSPSFVLAVETLGPARNRHRQPTRRNSLRRIGQIAAIAATLLVAAGIWQYPALMLAWQADYRTATGARSTIPLPDGSTMILNTATAVALDFEDGRRSVHLLQGEAFFDVRHDPARPFRVTGHFGEVEVKGTAFSVRTEEDADDIVLERGRVEVTCLCNAADRADLDPGEAVTATATSLSQVRTIDAGTALAWREGRISFEGQPLGHVLDELGRYYGGRIVALDSRVSRLTISGNYRLDDIEGAIRTLADAAGVGMTRIPGGIIILR